MKKITDFFKTKNNHQDVSQDKTWCRLVAETAKQKFESNKRKLNDRIVEGMKAGEYLTKFNVNKMKQLEKIGCKKIRDNAQQQILFGCDVVGLYTLILTQLL